MDKILNTPGPKDKKQDPESRDQNEQGPRNKKNEDSLADSSPTDSRSDEKVIVNEQRGNKIVNAPSQTAANTGEGNSYDENKIDD